MEKAKYIPLVVGLCSFVYYVALSAKSWTWMFMSSDSGDWLMTSNWWVVPQPYGSPLYISLMHLLGTFPGDTVVWATILLSCLPAAITVTLVYLIVHKLTQKLWPALTSSVVLLGAGVFLTQSTVLEEYALAIMFLTLAYFFYLNGRRMLTAVALGLGVAVHIFILPIAFFWFVLQYKQWRLWLKPIAIFIVCGILPYSLILVLMASDTPRVLAGGLNWLALDEYIFGIGKVIVGSLSLFEAPFRILAMTKILLMSIGLAFVPLYIGLKKPYDTKKLILLVIVCVSMWYHLTSLDPVSWTFMDFAFPAIAILVGIGLSKLTFAHMRIVLAGALVLIGLNVAFLNANVLTNQKPLAATYHYELCSLPDGSAVVTTAGAYSLGLFYVMSEGKELIPIIYPYGDAQDFPDHEAWMIDNYGVEGSNTLERTQYALDNGYDVYFAGAKQRYWKVGQAFNYDEGGSELIRPIVGLTGIIPQAIRPEQAPIWVRWNEVLEPYSK